MQEFDCQNMEDKDMNVLIFSLEVIGQKLISMCSKQHRQIKAFKHIGIASIFQQFCFADGNLPRQTLSSGVGTKTDLNDPVMKLCWFRGLCTLCFSSKTNVNDPVMKSCWSPGLCSLLFNVIDNHIYIAPTQTHL